MSEEQQHKSSSTEAGKPEGKPGKPSREERLSEALRANLRRRKSAARSRKEASEDGQTTE